MGIATSTFVIAAGALLRFAVTVTTTGFNLQSIGLILMIVGAAGLVASIAFWGSWCGFHARDGAYLRRTRVTRDAAGRSTLDRERTDSFG